MEAIVFKNPVFVGDIVSLFCETIRIGRTSITVKVDVWAERFEAPRQCVWVTEAEATYVHVDKDRNPIPIIKE
ncbi:MAG: acyl-CoA thioesterase YciA [Planctomycetota bacterium]|jgi:acyl-CoA thioesterase YciA